MEKLSPIKSEKIWGYEDWIASTHPNGFQKKLFEMYGKDYPLLVKIIQANENLSIQIHPDDTQAKLYENCRGKTECWYILSAEKNTKLIYGLKKDYSKEELKNAITQNTLEQYLNYEKVEAGDFIYIPAGTVHAICGGLRILEVQQSSDITYRLYDYGRGRECHIEKGLNCIKHSPKKQINKLNNTFTCPHFHLQKIEIKDNLSLPITTKNQSDITLLFILKGTGTINEIPVKEEEIFAFNSGETATINGTLDIIKITTNENKAL